MDWSWLEWGQEILPHLAINTVNEANIETEAMLDKEHEAQVDELNWLFLKDDSVMMKVEYDSKMEKIKSEYKERKKLLGGAMSKASRDIGVSIGGGPMDVDHLSKEEGLDDKGEKDKARLGEGNEEEKMMMMR
jgi:hypothetical protein